LIRLIGCPWLWPIGPRRLLCGSARFGVGTGTGVMHTEPMFLRHPPVNPSLPLPFARRLTRRLARRLARAAGRSLCAGVRDRWLHGLPGDSLGGSLVRPLVGDGGGLDVLTILLFVYDCLIDSLIHVFAR
jgi:hypothetical protein